jgi:hypothetical protein
MMVAARGRRDQRLGSRPRIFRLTAARKLQANCKGDAARSGHDPLLYS